MQKIAIKYGLLLFACIVSFFLLMKFFGQAQNFNFRALNGLFHLIFIYYAIRDYKAQFKEEFNYLSGTSTGIVTSMFAVIPFAIFVVIFLAIDTSLMTHLQENVPGVGGYLTPVGCGISILMEGFAMTFVLSYIITRFVGA